MKKLFSLSVFLTIILLLTGCEKEKPPVDKEFTPDHWPVVKTLGATPLTSSTVKLTGTVNAYGLATTVSFEYGTTFSYGKSVTANQSPVTGDSITNISADISGLTPDTYYHFRVKAENSLWKNFYGRDMVFTIHPPEIEKLRGINITDSSATLTGIVNAYGLSTTVTFEYGITTSYGNTVTADQSPVTGNNITDVSVNISGLKPCTTYHFRVKAENSLVTNFYSSDNTFTCADIPQWTTYTTADGLAGYDVRSIAIDAQGNKWFGTWEGGVSKFDGTNWTTYLSGYPVHVIAIDAQGNKWFGTEGGGVSKFDDTTWTTYNNSNGLVSNIVNAIAIDAQGNKWFGTDAGVSKFDGTNWTNYTTANSSLTNDYVYAIAIDAQGSKWFGTDAGVSRFDGTNWASDFSGYTVLVIAIDAQGNKWFGYGDGKYPYIDVRGVSKFDGTSLTTYNTANSGLAGNLIKAITIDGSNNIWISCRDFSGYGGWEFGIGVSKFDGTTWTTYTTSNSGLLSNEVTSIVIDAQGNKWFGTLDGVSKLSDTCN